MGIFLCNFGRRILDFGLETIAGIMVLCCIGILSPSCTSDHKSDVVKQRPATLARHTAAVLANCSYDNEVSSLGIGLVMAPEKFAIYNDSLLKNKFTDFDMYGKLDNSLVCSKFFKPDYGIMHFVCLVKTQKYYKVLNGSDEVKYLPATKGYSFISWAKYIANSFGVRRIKDAKSSQPLLMQPGGIDTVAIPKGFEMFCPIKTHGDWLQVKYDCFYNNEDNKHEAEPCSNYIESCQNPVSGWIRWRKANKLMIDIFVME